MLLPLVWMSSCRLPSSVRALLLLCVLILLLVALLLRLPPLLLLLLPLLPPLVVVVVLLLLLSPPPPPPSLLLMLLLVLLLVLLLLLLLLVPVKGENLESSCGMRPSANSPRFRKGMTRRRRGLSFGLKLPNPDTGMNARSKIITENSKIRTPPFNSEEFGSSAAESSTHLTFSYSGPVFMLSSSPITLFTLLVDWGLKPHT